MSLAPWCADEKWTYGVDSNGKRWAQVTGRRRCPLPASTMHNPLWMLANDYEQSVDQAPWFLAGWPEPIRRFVWGVRNPFENANLFVWGVADRNYTVTVTEGAPDPMVVQRDDLVPPQLGNQRATLALDDGTFRSWYSHVGKFVTFNWGCQPSGLFEFKLNFHVK